MALGLVPVSRIMFTLFTFPTVALTMTKLSLKSRNGTSSAGERCSTPSAGFGEGEPKQKTPGKTCRWGGTSAGFGEGEPKQKTPGKVAISTIKPTTILVLGR